MGVSYPINPPPIVKRYAHFLIEICFHIENLITNIIDLILNEKELKIIQSSNRGSIKHGEHFVEIYKKPIFEYLLKSPDNIRTIIERMNDMNSFRVIRILNELTEYVFKYKQMEKNKIKQTVDVLLELWPIIQNGIKKTLSSDLFLIELMSYIAMASPYPLYEIKNKAEQFNDWLINLIRSDASLELKSRAMFLLPCLTGINDKVNELVSDALRILQTKHFPLKSGEFPPASLERTALVSAFQSILDALSASKSLIILRFLIEATAADEKHIMEFKIKETLTGFMKNLKVRQQIDFMEISFKMFVEKKLEPSIRVVILKRFLLTIIRGSYVKSVEEFYAKNHENLMELLNNSIRSSGSGWDIEHSIVSRTGGYNLFEVIYGIVPHSLLKPNLIPIVSKQAFKTRTFVFVTTDPVCKEFYRKYQCSAYNALCSLISNTKDELRFYNLILFAEKDNELIWNRLLSDENDLYKFAQDFEEFPKIKERIISIRSQSHGDNSTTSVKYLQSTSVFESSLSQDVTKLDLNFSMVRTAEEVNSLETDQTFQEIGSLKLEKMPLNDHEVMANLCAVINHMYDNQITPYPELTSVRAASPLWVESICKSLANQNYHKNIRLFLAKLIENCRRVFRHFAPAVLGPILKLITDECAGNQLNYFITDLIVMIISWSEIYRPSTYDEINLSSAVLKFLMKNAFHDEREIFKFNLELIKNVVELWKDIINIPIQLLYDSLTVRIEKERICGIQLNAIVLANGLVPWTDVTKVKFLSAIFNCLNSEESLIYRPAAQLIGMCLIHLNEELDDENCFLELNTKLELIRKVNETKFMYILYCLHKNYPKIIDNFLQTVCICISTALPTYKKNYLEMLLSRIEQFDTTVYRELYNLGIIQLLKEESYQLIVLHIINKSIIKMNSDEISDLFELISSIQESKNPDCRDVLYEIMIFIRDTTVTGTELHKKSTAILLNGLTDFNSQIQIRIFNYWSDQNKLSHNLTDRFVSLLDHLYNPNSEQQFLGYCTQFLLELSIKNPDSKRQIFEFRTDDNEMKLKEYQINIKWSSHGSSLMSPLFVESQQKQLFSGSGEYHFFSICS